MQALQVDALREPARLQSVDVNERVSRCTVTPLGTLINRLSFSVVYSRLAIVGALTFDRKLFVSTTILAAFLNTGARMPIETLSAADSQHPFSDFLQFLQHVGRIAREPNQFIQSKEELARILRDAADAADIITKHLPQSAEQLDDIALPLRDLSNCIRSHRTRTVDWSLLRDLTDINQTTEWDLHFLFGISMWPYIVQMKSFSSEPLAKCNVNDATLATNTDNNSEVVVYNTRKSSGDAGTTQDIIDGDNDNDDDDDTTRNVPKKCFALLYGVCAQPRVINWSNKSSPPAVENRYRLVASGLSNTGNRAAQLTAIRRANTEQSCSAFNLTHPIGVRTSAMQTHAIVSTTSSSPTSSSTSSSEVFCRFASNCRLPKCQLRHTAAKSGSSERNQTPKKNSSGKKNRDRESRFTPLEVQCVSIFAARSTAQLKLVASLLVLSVPVCCSPSSSVFVRGDVLWYVRDSIADSATSTDDNSNSSSSSLSNLNQMSDAELRRAGLCELNLPVALSTDVVEKLQFTRSMLHENIAQLRKINMAEWRTIVARSFSSQFVKF